MQSLIFIVVKYLKTAFAAIAIMIGTTAEAQEHKPGFEKHGDLIKGTYYYEDGSIKQEGTYKNGKLHGKWVSYGQDGEKNAIAQYEEGTKTGKWFFWHDDLLNEVDYKDNRIVEVRKYKIAEAILQK